MKIGVALLCGSMVGLTASAASQLREYPDESLSGVKGVHVVVQYQAPNEGAYGLSQKDLEKAVKARLLADSVPILDDQAWHRAPGEPCLFVNVVGTRVEQGRKDDPVFVYSFSADFIQKVALQRTPSFTTEAATWSQGYFIVVPKEELDNVPLQVSDVAHDFAESLRQANGLAEQ